VTSHSFLCVFKHGCASHAQQWLAPRGHVPHRAACALVGDTPDMFVRLMACVARLCGMCGDACCTHCCTHRTNSTAPCCAGSVHTYYRLHCALKPTGGGDCGSCGDICMLLCPVGLWAHSPLGACVGVPGACVFWPVCFGGMLLLAAACAQCCPLQNV
jgi:hypothetical protein